MFSGFTIFLIAKTKQAHPGAETKEGREKSAASLQMLKTQKWGDAPIFPLAVKALAGWHGAKAPVFPYTAGFSAAAVVKHAVEVGGLETGLF